MSAHRLTPESLRQSVPEVESSFTLQGIASPITIYRDRQGIPHIRAQGVRDAFFGQGFAHAQDRLWQMDSDRMRAEGRWAELVGPSAVEQDTLFRRFRLAASSRSDYDKVRPETREMLDAYADGVNAFIRSTDRLPAEYGLLGIKPEPWQPWNGLAVYKVRHVLMGVWEGKAFRAKLLRHLGPERMARLYPATRLGDLLIAPPGGTYEGGAGDAAAELAAVMEALSREDGGGSNNWVISGARTASGKPLLAGDPHRAVDVPNVYYQNHLACDEFDVIGLSFPGLPSFPHFGHNDQVAWCITHVGADTQDLFVERFEKGNPRRYSFQGRWREAQVHTETIRVRGGEDVAIDVVITHHGPVIAGDPASGEALTMRYTATLGENPGWDCLRPMLSARSCAEFDAQMKDWVDPVNNLLYADVSGNIGYRTRGHVPVRSSRNGWLPVPGWSGEYEWQGNIPFAELPHVMNPATGYVVTANNRVVGEEYPYYLGHFFAPEHRARRITDRLLARTHHTVESMAAIHADVLSLPARQLSALLGSVAPHTAAAEQARALLLAWNGQMKADQPAPAIYATLREELLGLVLGPVLGPLKDEVFRKVGRGGPALAAQVRGRIFGYATEDDRTLLPDDATWPALIAEALERAVVTLQSRLGDDMGAWQWGRLHQLRPAHLLSAAYPEAGALLAPGPSPMDGDGDTVQAASYTAATGFTVAGTSVARYVFDLADWDHSAWVVPHGASGHPGSAHWTDQHQEWLGHRLVSMLYSWDRIGAEAEAVQQLRPASPVSSVR